MILALDTSGSFPSVALGDSAGKCIAHLESEERSHAEHLQELITSLFTAHSISWGSVRGVVVGLGPGSFTGLRLSLGFAKGVASALRVPLCGVSSFAGMAARYYQLNESYRSNVVVIADARRSEIFIQSFSRNEAMLPIALNEAHIDLLSSFDQSAVPTVVSNDKSVENLLPKSVKLELIKEVAVGLLALAPTSLGEYSAAQIAALEPNYLRAVAAKTIEERG